MYDTDQRLMSINKCAPPSHSIVVNQVIGERSEQEAFDIHICIPRQKPSAEQIINVFVKRLRITHVHLITNKVIVRGTFEVKAIYVGCMPCQPVHAVEIKGIRFTVDLPISGVRCGMQADASVIVEYIDYDEGCDHKVRDERYKKKYGHTQCQHISYGHGHDECHQDHCDYHQGYDKCHQDHGHHHQGHNECHQDHGHHHQGHNECHQDHGHHHQGHDECHQDHGHHHQGHDECHQDHGHHHQGHDECHQDHGHHHQSCCCPPHKIKCSREFDVSVVLRVNAKVMVDRPIMIHPIYPKLPIHPKG